MNKVYVLGGAQTDFERNWTREGKNAVAMLREVMGDGCRDAGIAKADLAALKEAAKVEFFMGSYLSELFNDQSHVAALLTEVNHDFVGIPAIRYEAAGASGSAAIDAAVAKIQSGKVDVAIVVGWALVNTVKGDVAEAHVSRSSYVEREGKGVEHIVPAQFGALTDAYLAKYDVPEETLMGALAQITGWNYANGKRNPKAITRKLFMSDKQANMRGTATNPLIGGKLAQSDATTVTDGAAVIVLCSESYKAKVAAQTALPYIKGVSLRMAPFTLEGKLAEGKTGDQLLPWTAKAVADAYAEAGVTVADIDVFELHDYYTISEYMMLSCAGLAKPGEEYKLIADGTIAFDGAKPVNPSGGQIGCGSPQAATGVRMLLDLSKQLRGTAGDYQVAGTVKNGLMINTGGACTSNYAIVVGI